MDVLILAAGLGSRVAKYTHDIIPKYLINIDNHTGLYHLIKYWNNYSKNIYLVINSQYNIITKFYINNVLSEYFEESKISDKIHIINYDSNDGTAYTLNNILNNDLKDKDIKNLLITWCDIYPTEKIIEPVQLNQETEKESDIYIYTYGNKCRYLLDDNNNIISRNENPDGNIIGIFYFKNYIPFNLDPTKSFNKDIVDFLETLPQYKIHKYELRSLIDYGDEEKFLNLLNIKSTNFQCRYFNELTIYDDKILKKGITDKGKEIIQFEKNWYNELSISISTSSIDSSISTSSIDSSISTSSIDSSISTSSIDLSISTSNIKSFILFTPTIYNLYENGILMQYKKNYIPLYEYFLNYEKNKYIIPKILTIHSSINNANYNIIKITILKNILDKLSKLHKIKKKQITKTVFLNNLKIEIFDKVYNRYKKVKEFIDYFGNIKIVNNIQIETLDTVIEKCKNIITTYYLTLDKYEYSIIHGDCNFSNILINPEHISDITFIDPRGYFGESKIYGPVEYDYAKILYAISGYDNFNSNFFNITSLNKDDNNLVDSSRDCPETYSITFKINPFVYDKKIIDKYFNKVHKAYMVIIWLSLAEYNKNNIWKCVASYYYGLYLGTIL